MGNINKIKSIFVGVLLLLVIYSSFVYSLILEDFEGTIWRSRLSKEVSVEGSIILGIETSDPCQGKKSLLLDIDLPAKLQSDGTIYSVDNEVYLIPSFFIWNIDKNNLEYFIYEIRSDIPGFVFGVSVYTKNYLWSSGQSVGGSVWKQVVIPLESIQGSDTWDEEGYVQDENIKGFTIPQLYSLEEVFTIR